MGLKIKMKQITEVHSFPFTYILLELLQVKGRERKKKRIKIEVHIITSVPNTIHLGQTTKDSCKHEKD